MLCHKLRAQGSNSVTPVTEWKGGQKNKFSTENAVWPPTVQNLSLQLQSPILEETIQLLHTFRSLYTQTGYPVLNISLYNHCLIIKRCI
jgi:hypothetical protein